MREDSTRHIDDRYATGACLPRSSSAPQGIDTVLVNGAPVVWVGQIQEGVFPGRAIRAPRSNTQTDGAER